MTLSDQYSKFYFLFSILQGAIALQVIPHRTPPEACHQYFLSQAMPLGRIVGLQVAAESLLKLRLLGRL